MNVCSASSGRWPPGAMTEAPLLHGGLLPEPLLAGPAVLDVLQHVAKHGPLPALVLPRPLHPLVHFGTWGGRGGRESAGTLGIRRSTYQQTQTAKSFLAGFSPSEAIKVSK